MCATAEIVLAAHCLLIPQPERNCSGLAESSGDTCQLIPQPECSLQEAAERFATKYDDLMVKLAKDPLAKLPGFGSEPLSIFRIVALRRESCKLVCTFRTKLLLSFLLPEVNLDARVSW